jgi:hypothetical protein
MSFLSNSLAEKDGSYGVPEGDLVLFVEYQKMPMGSSLPNSIMPLLCSLLWL